MQICKNGPKWFNCPIEWSKTVICRKKGQKEIVKSEDGQDHGHQNDRTHNTILNYSLNNTTPTKKQG